MAKEPISKGWAAVNQAAKSLATQDQTVRDQADRERERSQPAQVPLELIQPRPHGDTRPLDGRHLLDLAESITALSLLEPLVVDRKHRLLAGAHRWSAITLLSISDPEQRLAKWAEITRHPWPLEKPTQDQIEDLNRIRQWSSMQSPVYVPVRMVDIDAEVDESQALAIEVAENEKRRDYTKPEVVALADRLKAAGYRFNRGKPKAGERALGPALAVIIGKSERTVRRLIDGDQIRTDDLISDPLPGALRRLRSAMTAVQMSAKGQAKRKLTDVLSVLAVLDEKLTEVESKNEKSKN